MTTKKLVVMLLVTLSLVVLVGVVSWQFYIKKSFSDSVVDPHDTQTQVVPRSRVAGAVYEACRPEVGTDIDVTDFGAIPNDNFNDAPAFSKAFNCLFENAAKTTHKSGRLYIPAGEFHTSYALQKALIQEAQFYGLHIEGEGQDETTLVYVGSQPTNLIGLKFNSNNYVVTISNLTLKANQRDFGTAISIVGPDRGVVAIPNVTIRNVEISGVGNYDYFSSGIRQYATKRAYIDNVKVHGPQAGVENMAVCFSLEDVYGPTITNSSCSNAEVGVSYFSQKLGGLQAPEGGSFLKNYIEHVTTGIYVKTFSQEPGVMIGENIIHANNRAVKVDGRRYAEISSNIFNTTSNTPVTYTDIELNGVGSSQINSNQFIGSAKRVYGAILLNDLVTPMINGANPTRSSDNNLVSQNDFNSIINPVRETGGANNNIVKNNR